MDDVSDTWYGVAKALWDKCSNEPVTGTNALLNQVQLQASAAKWKVEGDEALQSLWEPSEKQESKSFSSQMMKSGTAKDKMATMVVTLQSGPIENALMLKKLLSSAKRGQRAMRVLAAESLADVFASLYLPSDRKLYRFMDPVTLNRLSFLEHEWKEGKLSDKEWTQCLFWSAWEDWLKLRFAEYIGILGEMSKDTLQWVRYKSIDFLGACLKSCAEGEKVVLSLIVNKLGDSVGKISSHSSKVILEFVESSGNSDSTVILQNIVKNEIEMFLSRKELDSNAKLSAVNLLTQFHFYENLKTSRMFSLTLLQLYFRLFQEMINDTDLLKCQAKMLSSILTGIDRSLPFTVSCLEEDQGEDIERVLSPYMDKLFLIIHGDSFPAKIQSLSILYQVVKSVGSSSEKLVDRFYNCLYSFVSDPENILHIFDGARKMQLLLNVLYRAIKNDCEHDRVMAFVKRLLQACLYSKPQVICSIIYLISKLSLHCSFIDSMISVPEDHQMPSFDPSKRNPKAANAANSCSWELLLLQMHFHPSVQRYLGNLLRGESIEYKGDFLKDFSGPAFLERFVFKNPKQSERVSTSSFARDTSSFVRTREELDRIRDEVDGSRLFQKYFETRKVSKEDNVVEEDEEEDDEDAFADRLFQRELDNNAKSMRGGDDGESDEDDGLEDVFDDQLSDEDDDDEEGISFADEQEENNSPFAGADEFATLMEKIQQAKPEHHQRKPKRKNGHKVSKKQTKRVRA